MWNLQIHGNKFWQCAWYHWKSIAVNWGQYSSKSVTSEMPQICIVCVMSITCVTKCHKAYKAERGSSLITSVHFQLSCAYRAELQSDSVIPSEQIFSIRLQANDLHIFVACVLFQLLIAMYFSFSTLFTCKQSWSKCKHIDIWQFAAYYMVLISQRPQQNVWVHLMNHKKPRRKQVSQTGTRPQKLPQLILYLFSDALGQT